MPSWQWLLRFGGKRALTLRRMHALPLSPALTLLQERLAQGQAVVGIYGLGYVGLPLALRFAQVGIKVLGFDIDPVKVETLNNGGSYIERLTPDLIEEARARGFAATSAPATCPAT